MKPATRTRASRSEARAQHRDGALPKVVALGALLLCAAGCATVAPYERERLAREDMQLDRNADSAAGQEHATAYREGTAGAVGASGGGCGCN